MTCENTTAGSGLLPRRWICARSDSASFWLRAASESRTGSSRATCAESRPNESRSSMIWATGLTRAPPNPAPPPWPGAPAAPPGPPTMTWKPPPPPPPPGPPPPGPPKPPNGFCPNT
jgi:hypothetical protein